VDVTVAGAPELTGRADRRQHRDVYLGPVLAVEMVDQLVHVVGEGVLGVGALVQLGEHVALHGEDRRPRARELKLHVVLPFHLVAHVILVPGVGRVGDRQHLVGMAEREPVGVAIEIGAAGVAPVLVAEGASPGSGGWMPGGVDLAVGPEDGVGIVLLLGAAVAGAGSPDAEGAAGRRAARIDEPVSGRAGGGAHQSDQQQARCRR
jgi:hypothetical protein